MPGGLRQSGFKAKGIKKLERTLMNFLIFPTSILMLTVNFFPQIHSDISLDKPPESLIRFLETFVSNN